MRICNHFNISLWNWKVKIETTQDVMFYISNEQEVHFYLRAPQFIFIGIWVIEGRGAGKGELY
jgi:hypothetical protein